MKMLVQRLLDQGFSPDQIEQTVFGTVTTNCFSFLTLTHCLGGQAPPPPRFRAVAKPKQYVTRRVAGTYPSNKAAAAVKSSNNSGVYLCWVQPVHALIQFDSHEALVHETVNSRHGFA
jgi:hypothetical protein